MIYTRDISNFEDKDFPNNVGIEKFPERFEKVLEMLKREGISRVKICEELGLEYATLRSYYRKINPSFPRLGTLVAFCDKYNISYKYLLHGSKYAREFSWGDYNDFCCIPLDSNLRIKRYVIKEVENLESYQPYIYIKNKEGLYEKPYETDRINIMFKNENIDMGNIEFREKFYDFIKFLIYSKK